MVFKDHPGDREQFTKFLKDWSSNLHTALKKSLVGSDHTNDLAEASRATSVFLFLSGQYDDIDTEVVTLNFSIMEN